MWQVTSSKGYGCDAHPKNVAAWAALMIDKGLVKNIYNYEQLFCNKRNQDIRR